jgi:RND family efflux transporter MFP subunit
VLSSCRHQEQVLEKSATPVRLAAVERYVPSNGQTYSASMLPNRQVNLAFKVNGFVESIHQVPAQNGRSRNVDIGDIVSQGTLLAQVRSKDYQLQVAQAEGQVNQVADAGHTAQAQLQQAQAGADKAEHYFARADALFKNTSLTKSDYDTAKANRDATQAQVEAARSQLQASSGSLSAAQATLGSANLAVHDTSLVAPFRSAVVQRSVELGTLTGPGTVAFVLADVSTVKATFAVPDILVSGLKNGSRLSIYAEAFPDAKFHGNVSAVAAVADSTTRSFQVEVTVPNARALLRPGMIASVDVGETPGSYRPLTVVPLNAIVRGEGEQSQFAVVVVEDGIAKRKPVTLGSTYGDRISITGVPTGSRVVVSGATLVNDGEPVKVIP